MCNALILFLEKEYPTATAFEIAKTLEIPVPEVREGLHRTREDDHREYARRGTLCFDPKFIAIMRKRVAWRKSERAA